MKGQTSDLLKTERHLVKRMDKLPNETENHLHSNKFMRTEDVMSDIWKKMKGQTSDLLKTA